MKKLVASVLAAMMAGIRPVCAYVLVEDVPKYTQDAIQNGIVNVQNGLNYVQYVNSAMNTLHTYQQTVIQVARSGDPAAIRNLPGISEVSQLTSTGQQAYQGYARLPQYFSPTNYQADANTILSQFGQPAWNGWTTASGASVPLRQSAYQFDVSRWNVADRVLSLLQQNQTERQRLQAQRNQLQQQLTTATTDAETKKLHAQLDNVNAALAQLDARDQQAVAHGQQQQVKINAGQQVTRAASVEQRQAAEYQQVNQGLAALPGQGAPVSW
jgi:predicted ribosome quality control (RQC) complex YloA/Tae2 family protein